MDYDSRTAATAAAAVAATSTLPALLPAFALHSYAKGDPYLCGDLGSLGAAIGAFFGGVVLFVLTVCVAAAALRRKRVLLVAPVGAVAAFGAAYVPLDLLSVGLGTCDHPVSLALLALLALVAGGMTYLMGYDGPATPRA
ncbi:MAG TPA: hypothetical protein VNA20_12115 [Frankiaceae bacterium]|nr:hypothetical protein [Frankiaceae bacterium]